MTTFGFTDEDDRLWAQGWPHMVIASAGDASPKQTATYATFQKAFVFAARPEMPIGAVHRELRYRLSRNLEAPLTAAVQNPAPVTDAELREIAAKMVRSHVGDRAAFMMEAVRSTDVAIHLMIDAYLASESWHTTPMEALGSAGLRGIAMMLLRASAATVEESRARLQSLAVLVGKIGLRPTHRAYQTLLDILSPTPAALPNNLILLTTADAAAIRDYVIPTVTTMKPRDRIAIDARLAYLGGEPVLEAIARHAAQFHKDEQARLVVGLARCAHPAVRTFMETVGSRAAKAWLKATA